MSRIDVHHHLLPPVYTAWLRGREIHRPGGRDLPEWSPERSLELMDAHRIRAAVLSLSAPGVHLGDDKEGRAMARQVNDYAASCVAGHPDRFGFFAALPLPDVDGALAEAAHALDELGADGVSLPAHTDGTYLGDPAHEPLFAFLDERSAVVHIHPSDLPGPPVPGLPPFAADFLLDTTRAAMNLVLHDIPRRFPNLRLILSHGGGFLPYAAHRIAAALFAETGREPGELLDSLTSFHFDTALSSSPTALPSLLAFARPGHVLYGSDWPFAPDLAVGYFTGLLDTHEQLAPADHRAIDSDSALSLFPRLALPPSGLTRPA
ncbi:amidohydrolase family protein [Streptomyces sp. NPDC058274]|uniref:amidohydrolase family protein n=1 Tax=Streptomyces sp. NPDC058274 TaxID=3346416 RepID=UPI0036EFD204